MQAMQFDATDYLHKQELYISNFLCHNITQHSEHLISGRWKQGLVPKIGKCHIVKMRHLYASNVNLIRNWPPNNKQMNIGPRNPQFNFKKKFFWLVFQH